jgi:hypothetical protein
MKIRKPRKDKPKIGDRKIRNDGKGHRYHWIYTEEGWDQLHRYNWLQAGNTIPDKDRLLCIDGNTLNADPSNWRLKVNRERKDPLWGTRTRARRQAIEQRRMEREAKNQDKKGGKRQKSERLQILQQQAGEAYQKLQEEKKERRRQVELAKEQNKKKRAAAQQQAQIEKQWQQSGRKSRKKEEVKRLSTIQRDFSKSTWVQVDKKTRIELRPSQTIEQVIAKYSKKTA